MHTLTMPLHKHPNAELTITLMWKDVLSFIKHMIDRFQCGNILIRCIVINPLDFGKGNLWQIYIQSIHLATNY